MKNYPAVSIVTAGNCCLAVKSLKGIKALAVAAPRLPLPDCSMPHACQCRFQKYADRRAEDEDRRLLGSSERSTWFNGAQRRKSRSRRAGD